MNWLEGIKKLAIIAMFSDDKLMEILVLKGGNVLDVVYGISSRGSVDIDFSIEREFDKKELTAVKDRIERALEKTFREKDYKVFDLSLREKPPQVSQEMKGFWGGYVVEFKILEIDKYDCLIDNQSDVSSRASVVGPSQRKTFKIDISKFEFCAPKQQKELDGYTIYVYTPEMVILEKIRAICQQMQEYKKVVTNPSQSPRARDFFDIYTVQEHFKIDFTTQKIAKLLKNIFDAKRVPLSLIGIIPNYREYHRENFVAVKNTLNLGTG